MLCGMLRNVYIAMALLAIASILLPTQMSAFASTQEEKNDLDIQEQGDEDNNAKMLKMAIKEGGKTNKVNGFKLTPDNVLVVEPNKKVEVTEDLNSGDTFDRALITDTRDTEKKIPITAQGVVDLKGYKEGAYTLDVVIKSGDKKIAYECIIVIGEKNEQNRNKGNTEANRVSETTTINKKITIIKRDTADCGPGTEFDENTDKCEIIKKPPPPPCKQGQVSTKEKSCTPPKPPGPKPPGPVIPPDGVKPPGPGPKPCAPGQQSTPANPCTPPKPPVKDPTPKTPIPPAGPVGGDKPGESCTLADGRPGKVTGTQAQGNLNCAPTGVGGATTAPTGAVGTDCNLPGGNTGGKVTNTPSGNACIAGTGGQVQPPKPPTPPSPGGPPAGGTVPPAGVTPPSPGGPTPPGGKTPIPPSVPGGPGTTPPSPGGPVPFGGVPPGGTGPDQCKAVPQTPGCPGVDDPRFGPPGSHFVGPNAKVTPQPDGSLKITEPGKPDLVLPPLSIPGFTAKPGWTFKVTPGSHTTLFPPLWGTGMPGAPGPAPAPGSIGPDGLPVPAPTTPPAGGAVGQGAQTLPPDQPGIAAIQPTPPPELPPDTVLPPQPPAGQGPPAALIAPPITQPGPSTGDIGPVPTEPIPDPPLPTMEECEAAQNQLPRCEEVNPDPGHVITPPTPTGPEDCPSGILLESFPPKCAPLPEPTDGGPPLTVDPPAPIGPEDCPSGRILESFPPKCAPIPDPPTDTPTPPIDPGHIACNPGQVSTPENPCNDTGQTTDSLVTRPGPGDPCDNPANANLPECQNRPTPNVCDDPAQADLPECQEPTNVTPIPDPPTDDTVPIPEPNICDDPANANEPECQGQVEQEPTPDTTPDDSGFPTPDTPEPEPEESLLFDDPTATLEGTNTEEEDGDNEAARTLPPEGTEDYDGGNGNLVPPTPDVTTEGLVGDDRGDEAARTLGENTNEDEESGVGTMDLVPPTPDTTTEGGVRNNGGGDVAGTMDETNPQDRTAPPIVPTEPAPLDCEAQGMEEQDGICVMPEPELDCESQGMEEEDGQCVLPEPEEQEQAPMEELVPQEEFVPEEPEQEQEQQDFEEPSDPEGGGEDFSEGE